MDNTYRFRFLIYLAAFVFIMSLCFAYAEPVPSHPLPFGNASSRMGMPAAGPVFNPDDLSVAVTPAIPNVLVLKMESEPRGLFHIFRRHRDRDRADYRALPAGLSGMVILPSGIAISTP